MRSVGVAVEIGLQEIWISVLSGKAPELRLDRLLGRAGGEIELSRQKGFVSRNLLSARLRKDVVADRDHHAGDIGARRRQTSEQRCGEGAIAAASVERDVVGLRREGDEESGKLADASESGRRQPGGEGIVAAGVEKDEMASFSLPEFSEHGIERNRPRRNVADLAELGADRDEVVTATELKAVSGIVQQRHIGVGRLQARIHRWRAAWRRDRDQA